MKRSPKPFPSLQQVLEKYHEYVNNELFFDSPAAEIAGFVEFALNHTNCTETQAQEFYYAAAGI